MVFSKIKIPVSVLAFLLLSLVLLSLHLMSSATQASSELSQLYSSLVLINAIGSVILLFLVGVNVYSLFRQIRKREAGSQLTIKMVLLFVLLSLAPAGIVFYYSVQFLDQSIDSWFNVEIDRAMDDALEISQVSLEQKMRDHLKKMEKLAEHIVAGERVDIEVLRDSISADELTLLSSQGHIEVFSSVSSTMELPDVENTLLTLGGGDSYIGLDAVNDGGLSVRVIVRVHAERPQLLHALFPVSQRIADLADSVEFAFVRYQEMTYLRNSLKISFSLTLGLVLLLSLLAAIWIAFISIRNIIAPVKQLVKGTQAVASGDYSQQLPVLVHDDMGFLVESFNKMSQRVGLARDEARLSSIEIEDQRAYLQTILSSLTSGVISLDGEFNIRTANQAADAIFHCEINQFSGQPLLAFTQGRSDLQHLVTMIHVKMEYANFTWQQHVSLLGPKGRQEILCRGAPLFSQRHGRIGAVIVFDDVSDLVQAQKNAAWGEVARRLAHEIKNPLTPIQLSAERLQLKLSGVLDESSATMLERSTKTIVQQVEVMKKMVDEFAEYAKPSKKNTESISLPDLIQQVVALYSLQPKVEFRVRLGATVPDVEADPIQVRQVLHNLIKNALEALAYEGCITVTVQFLDKKNAQVVEVGVYDNGPGIKSEQTDHIFEPYITHKEKGTGLGLAIVKKIVEEHRGSIWLDTEYHDGAGFVFQLPLV